MVRYAKLNTCASPAVKINSTVNCRCLMQRECDASVNASFNCVLQCVYLFILIVDFSCCVFIVQGTCTGVDMNWFVTYTKGYYNKLAIYGGSKTITL